MKLNAIWLLACVTVIGCAPPAPVAPVLMGEGAPTLGAEGLNAFVIGKWAVTVPPMDPNIAKMPGMDALAEQMDEMSELQEVYEFKADGTFTYSYYDQPWKVTGTWTANPQMIALQYKNYNDKTLQQLGDEKRKESEVGTQAGVMGIMMYDNLMASIGRRPMLVPGADKKILMFTTGETGIPSGPSGGALSRCEATDKK